MKYKDRDYKCSACGTVQKVGTNHIGEIYSSCKNCKASPLFCVEPEAIEARNQRPYLVTTLHAYNLNISRSAEFEQYEHLKAVLNDSGHEIFDSIDLSGGHRSMLKKTDSLNGKEVRLYTDSLFKNQWVEADNGLRLFDWAEPIFPNPDVKHGYWLTITEQMMKVRFENHKCKYCGTVLPTSQNCNKTEVCKNYGMEPLILGKQKTIYVDKFLAKE